MSYTKMPLVFSPVKGIGDKFKAVSIGFFVFRVNYSRKKLRKPIEIVFAFAPTSLGKHYRNFFDLLFQKPTCRPQGVGEWSGAHRRMRQSEGFSAHFKLESNDKHSRLFNPTALMGPLAMVLEKYLANSFEQLQRDIRMLLWPPKFMLWTRPRQRVKRAEN